MKLDQRSISAIREYCAAAPENRSLVGISTVYWKALVDEITQNIHAKKPIDGFLAAEKDFINCGITPELFANPAAVVSAINNRPIDYPYIQIKLFTTWIAETFARISNVDKKELVEKDIKRLAIERTQIQEEIGALQVTRNEFLLNELCDNLDRSTYTLIENLDKTDVLCRENLVTKRAVSRGLFMSVEERRGYAARNAQYQKEVARNDGLQARFKNNDDKKKLRDYNTGVIELLEKSVVSDDQISEKQKELLVIADQNQKLTPMEVESRVRTEIEYVRDLVKLVARRLHLESCSLLRPDDQFFTLEKVVECFKRIFEFDPMLFNNERVSYVGKPSVLLIPGNGNALYDWKNNQIVIPLVPPGGNFMGSIATGIVEYRIDVDEEKKMMHSYQKTPENKLVKSIVTLRANLTRDYLRWMTSEYAGFKVLGKDARLWFEHEIGPRKNEIFCPQELQPFAMDQKQFTEAFESAKKRIKDDVDAPTRLDDLWAASVMASQLGKYDDALNYLDELTGKNPEHKFAWYNLGMLCMKNMRAPDAQKAFRQFMTKGARSWWTAVAAEHLRHLMDV